MPGGAGYGRVRARRSRRSRKRAALVLRLQGQIRQNPDDAGSHRPLGLGPAAVAGDRRRGVLPPRGSRQPAGARARREEFRSPLGAHLARAHATPLCRSTRLRATGSLRWRPPSRGRSAQSAMRSSSWAATARASRRSTSWGRSSRACPPTPASRTRGSCSATTTAPSPRCGWLRDRRSRHRGGGLDGRPPRQAFLLGRRPHRARSGSTASRSPTCPGYAAAFDGLALVEAARERLSRASSSRDGRSRGAGCRSTSRRSATSCGAPVGLRRRPPVRELQLDRARGARVRRTQRPRRGAGPHRPRRERACRDGPGGTPTSSGGRGSRLLTPSPGASPARAGAPRRRGTRSAHSGWAPRTPRSSSTAG